MCGIAGRLNFRSGEPVDLALLRRMTDLIAHRGPDGEGFHVDGPVGLGHRRLAIIDLSPRGRQPMTHEDGGVWITFNGEIYNFPELKQELQGRGYRFHTDSDTEVILTAYREFGIECLGRLHGMFGLALWDAPRRRLLLARDRLGKKPLHYLVDQRGLAFASEPKAFLADPAFTPRPEPEALSALSDLPVRPGPLLGLPGGPEAAARPLPRGRGRAGPGGALLAALLRPEAAPLGSRGDGAAADAPPGGGAPPADQRRPAGRLPERRHRLERGGRLHGGALDQPREDLFHRLRGAGVRRAALRTAGGAALRRRITTSSWSGLSALEVLPALVWHYNEPYADSSAIPTYYLAEMTRRHVTVALNGDAGDENFAGYERYVAHAMASRWEGRLPRPAWRAVAGLASLLPASSRTPRSVAQVRRLLVTLGLPGERRYARWMSHFQPEIKAELCTEDFRRAAGSQDSEERLVAAFRASSAPDVVDATLDVDVQTYLPDDLLVKVDIATMAHSLEGRSPFLDHELMQFCASLPSSMKLRGRVKKYLLKRAVADLVPPEVIARPKMGFGVPLARWFREELREMTHDVLLGRRARERGYFRPGVVERLIDEHVRGVRPWHFQLWNLLMFELWHQTFIDAAGGAWERMGRRGDPGAVATGVSTE